MAKPILAAFLSCSGYCLTDEEKYLFEKNNPLGISLFARNIKTPQQIKSLTKEIRETIGRKDVLIAVDQEGGRVQRLTAPYFRKYAGNSQIGALTLQDARQAAQYHAQLISSDLNACGINTNYAPVLDLAYPDTTPAIKSRCFSDNEKSTAILGKTMADEYIKNGILPCIKHMPGHGRAQTDPHLHLPVLNNTLKELAKDFYPFQQLKDCPFGMTAHILLPEIDNRLPLTLSKKGIDGIIRGEIGFSGLLITDAIEMKALSGSTSEKASAAYAAGCEAVCYCQGKIEQMDEICRLKQYLSDKSLNKIANIQKLFETKKQDTDIKTIEKAYAALMGEMPEYQESYDATEVLNQLQN